jgi:hypothetical protein
MEYSLSRRGRWNPVDRRQAIVSALRFHEGRCYNRCRSGACNNPYFWGYTGCRVAERKALLSAPIRRYRSIALQKTNGHQGGRSCLDEEEFCEQLYLIVCNRAATQAKNSSRYCSDLWLGHRISAITHKSTKPKIGNIASRPQAQCLPVRDIIRHRGTIQLDASTERITKCETESCIMRL